MLEVDIPVVRPDVHYVSIRSFRKCPWDEVRHSLSTAPWHVMDIYDDVNDMWHFFISILYRCLDMYAPSHTVPIKHSRRPTPWITPDLLTAIKHKSKAKRRAESTGLEADFSYYRHLKNRLKVLVREAKLSYLNQLLLRSKHDPHTSADLWSGINNILGRYRLRWNLLDSALSLDDINSFFSTVAVTSEHRPASCFDITESADLPVDAFQFSIVSEPVILSLLSHLDVRKSVGPDGLSARFLKEAAEQIVSPLTKIYNKSLVSGVVPQDWKCSNVTPVHKGGPCNDPGNFRPISVVPIVAKILEKVVSNQLHSFLERNELLSPYQGAYRRGKSTEQILLVASDAIAQALDSGKSSCIAFLDLRKAFDSLDHVLLLQRLHRLGVCGKAIAWFTSYLSYRKQRVKCGGRFSEWRFLNGGIPQDSALGPLLFLIYMNEMPSQVRHGRLLQYADDTALICSGADFAEVHHGLTEDLQSLSAWIARSKMKLNIAKSSVMWFKPKASVTGQIPVVYLGDGTLRSVSTQKYLGVVFDDQLKWDSHVANVSKKVSYYLYWINAHYKHLPNDVLKLLIDSLVLSRLSYALPVWGPAISKQNLHRLQRLHNWAVRIVGGLRKFDHVSGHRVALGWLPVDTLIQYRTLCTMHQLHHRTFNLLDPPILFGPQHTYVFYTVSPYIRKYCKMPFFTNTDFFRYQGAKWWNNLPASIIAARDFSSTVYNHFLYSS